MPTEEQTYREGVIDRLTNLQSGIDKLDVKISYTNGKVRKLTISLVLLGGLLLGELLSPHDIISLLASHFL